MHTTIQVHVRDDSVIEADIIEPGLTPTLRILADGGDTEVVLFFPDDVALQLVREKLAEFAHEEPFHLRYRSGCPACQRVIARVAERVAATGED